MTTENREYDDFNPFSIYRERQGSFKEKWAKMTDKEKLDFVNKRVEGDPCDKTSFFIKMIDQKCKRWMNKSTQEKEEFIAKKISFKKNAI